VKSSSDHENHSGTKNGARKSSSGTKKTSGTKSSHHRSKKKKKLSINMILLFVILAILAFIVIRLMIWNKGFKIDISNSKDNTAFDTEPMDSIVPLNSTNPDAQRANKDDELNMLFLGNAPLSDDADSSDNLVSMIQKQTDATNVYNCSIANSFMSSKNASYSKDYPMDAFSFYQLALLLTSKNTQTYEQASTDMGTVPADAQNAVKTLQSIDCTKLDAICIFYDGSDFEEQRLPYSDTDTSDVTTYAGALEAGVKLIQQTYPDIRIIVMSPAYAYYLTKDGKKVSSFDTSNFTYSLYIYVIHEQDTCYRNNVSFVDNFYGTIYEEIADKYLSDYIHVNTNGRKLLAKRYIYALNRFHDYELPASTEETESE
jgi:hypothetical protein